MQLKMPRTNIKFDKNKVKKLLEEENEFILDLLFKFDVPDSVEDEQLADLYLIDSKAVKKSTLNGADTNRAQTAEELEDRLNIIKNKMKSKRNKISERGLKKREAKKMKKNKEIKKILVSAQKSLQNENNKFVKVEKIKKEEKPEGNTASKPVFNEEGKIVFSKFDFASHPGAKAKKNKKDKTIRNPKLLLKQIKDTDRKMKELKEQGDDDKVKEMKSEMAWQKAFDKVEGKKVKDDPKLLVKAIKKKKDIKLKSKKKWTERKQKVEQGIASKQKKRQDNIDKRQKDKKSRKLKRLSKKGRVIPGF